jgi:hypothetical protein
MVYCDVWGMVHPSSQVVGSHAKKTMFLGFVVANDNAPFVVDKMQSGENTINHPSQKMVCGNHEALMLYIVFSRNVTHIHFRYSMLCVHFHLCLGCSQTSLL